MSYKPPHRKREPVSRKRAEGGEWVARDSGGKTDPDPLSDYWSSVRMQEADWGGHRIFWRPRTTGLTAEERMINFPSKENISSSRRRQFKQEGPSGSPRPWQGSRRR